MVVDDENANRLTAHGWQRRTVGHLGHKVSIVLRSSTPRATPTRPLMMSRLARSGRSMRTMAQVAPFSGQTNLITP